MFLKSYNTC